jgi:hypothetical protein
MASIAERLDDDGAAPVIRSMTRSLLLSLLILLISSNAIASSAIAQSRIDGGVAIGKQAYENMRNTPSVVNLDVLFSHFDLALAYANLEAHGSMYALHADLVYRRTFGDGFSFLLGGGPTVISIGGHDTHTTVNALGEIGYKYLYVSVRQFDYHVEGFRQSTRPKGPVVAAGVRFTLRK